MSTTSAIESDLLAIPDEETGLVQHHQSGNEHTEPHHQQHAHHHHDRSLGESVPLYSAPKQRQRWGDVYTLPHVNWGDLFFDLFYVAAAANLDDIMEDEPSLRGLLYFASCYSPVFFIWREKVFHDARFAPDDNLFHRFLEAMHLVILATIVQHVRPASIMAATYRYPDTMIFSFGLFLDGLFQINKYRDIYFNVHGGDEARRHSFDDMRRKSSSSVFYLIAAIIAGYDYFFLSSENTNLTNMVPILLCLIGGWIEQVYLVTMMKVVMPLLKFVHREHRVPVNLEFSLHRMGEWVMLMLGETVLNLLIVTPSNTVSYNVTFYTGIIAVTMLQYLYFRSQPFEVDDHALRRSIVGAMIYLSMLVVYSGALILFGGSYKLMLDQYHLELTHGPDFKVGLYTLAERRVRIANVFSWSLTIGLAALDNMLISHRGYKVFFHRFVAGGRFQVVPIFIFCFNLVIMGFTVTLSQWVTSLELLSLLGVAIVLVQVLLRTLGMRYFPVSKAAMARACLQESISMSQHSLRQIT